MNSSSEQADKQRAEQSDQKHEHALGEQVQALLQREIAGFDSLIECSRLTGGASQETYHLRCRVNDREEQFALRRAAGGALKATSEENIGLDVEAKLIILAGQHGVPVPVVRYILQEEDGLGSGFLMSWIDGETRGARIVRDAKYVGLRKTLAYECGATLAHIHKIDPSLVDAVLPERDPTSFVRSTWQRYRDLKTPQPMIDYTAQWLLQHLPKRQRRALVHNDFRNGNLMVSETKLLAVLDWEVAHIGDPYRDLGWICTNSWRFGGDAPVGGFGAREDLFAGYESESEDVVVREDVRYWEVFGSFWWAIGCLMMADHYRHGPDPTVERPAIGRRSSECQIDCVNLLIPGPVTEVQVVETQSDELPTSAELITSVADFLRDEVMGVTEGRVNFLSRVAANSLDIVAREQRVKHEIEAQERDRLCALLNSSDDIFKLRWRLTDALRNNELELNDETLQSHLRQTTFDQVAVDQPSYSGFIEAKRLAS